MPDAWDGELREGVALARLVDADAEQALGRVAFVILRPHALEAGHGPALVRALAAEHGARPVAVRVLPRLDPALVDALYRRQARLARGRVWLQQAAFGTGPAAALLLAGDEPGLTGRLHAAKGTSSALASPPGSLRARFARPSSLHAVLHVSENPRELIFEASLFFAWATIRAAASAAPLDLDRVLTLVSLEPVPGRLIFQAVCKTKLRILAAIGGHADLWELTARADARLEGADYVAQRDVMLAFATAERALLAAAIKRAERAVAAPRGDTRARAWAALRAATMPAELLYASWLLSGHEPFTGAGEELFAALDAGDVPLSAAQRALLATGLSTDLHPAERFEGERLWPLGVDPRA